MEGEDESGVTFEKKQRAKQPFRARKKMTMGLGEDDDAPNTNMDISYISNEKQISDPSFGKAVKVEPLTVLFSFSIVLSSTFPFGLIFHLL